MKSLLLSCLVVGLTVATTLVKDTAFRPRREYLYHYDTQVLTGLPGTSNIYSGIRLSCYVKLQFITLSKVRVVFESITLYQLDEPFEEKQVQESLLSQEYLNELTGPEVDTMQMFLQIPFGFDYSNGIVLDVSFEDRETEWSINLKRGLISIFQMNLSKRMLMKDNLPPLKLKMPHNVDWYNVMERSVLGDCATLYTVAPTGQARGYYVTKARDFSSCIDYPIYFNSIFRNQEKSSYLKDERFVQEANMKYSVRGSPESFIILSAIGEGNIEMRPYGNQPQMRTSINQTLFLRDAKFLSDTLEIPDIPVGKHKLNTLRMTLPSGPVDPQDPFQLRQVEPKKLDQPADVYQLSKIKLHLILAAQNTLTTTDEHALTQMRIAIDMLKTSPRPLIRKLWDILSTRSPSDAETRLASDILWKVLPNVATDAAFNVVLEICMTELHMTDNCTWALNKLALKATPTTELISKLILFTGERSRHLKTSVKHAAYLALGSLGYRLNVEKFKHLKEIDRSVALLMNINKDNVKNIRIMLKELRQDIERRRHKIINIWTTTEEKIMKAFERLLKSPSFDDKVLALKSIGNSGMQDAIPTLKQYLFNTAQPSLLRVLAVTAFRRMWYPEEARQEVISILRTKVLDINERSEIRNLAFDIMSGLRPTLPVYETIADSLRTEKDKHVTSFIMSFLHSFANSSYPPEWPMRRNASSALLLGPKDEFPHDTSFFKQMTTFNEDYKFGAAARMTSLGDKFGYKGCSFNLDTYLGGYLSQLAEIGLNTEGIGAVIEKLFGPRGLLSHKKSLFDLLRRAPRDLSPQQMIDHIFKMLSIKPRTMPMPYGHFYYKMMGDELGYLDFTAALRQLTSEGKIPVTFDGENLGLGLPISLNTMFDFTDNQLTLPTEAGLPITSKFQAMSTVDIQGTVAFKVKQFVMEEDRLNQPPVSIDFGIDIKPKITFGMYGSLGVDMFYYKPFVGFTGLWKSRMPIRLDASIDTVYSKLKILQHLAPEVNPLAEMLVEPVAQFLMYPKEAPNPVIMLKSQQILDPYGVRNRAINGLIPIDAIGYKIAVTGQVPTYLSPYNVFRPFAGRTLLNVFLKPMANAPSTLKFMAQVLYPTAKSIVSPVYATTYQKEHTDHPYNFGRDMSEMRGTGLDKYDKYGRPLPASLDDILPLSDPVNLEHDTVTLQQLSNKFQNISGKPVPYYNLNSAIGVIMTLDASHESTLRQFAFESIWAFIVRSQITISQARFWRSPIPGVSPNMWQAMAENVFVSSTQVFQPKDLLDPRKQIQIMNELQHLVSLKAHKVINEILNVSVLTDGQQFNYPSMVSAAPYRANMAMVPWQLYKLMNATGPQIYKRQWKKYWEILTPVFERIVEERHLSVDRFSVQKDVPYFELLDNVILSQKYLLSDIEDIISEGYVAHAEMPILQAINHGQMKSTYLLSLIIEKAAIKGLINNIELMYDQLHIALANVNTITTKVAVMWDTVSSVSDDMDTEGKPVVLFRPPMLRRHSKQPAFYTAKSTVDAQPPFDSYSNAFSAPVSSYYTSDTESPEEIHHWTLETVSSSLYNLSQAQMHLIKEVETAVYNKADFDYSILAAWIQQVESNFTLIDAILAKRPIYDSGTRESLLLVSVQNEILIILLEEWQLMYNEKFGPRKENIAKKQLSLYVMLIKRQGQALTERSSLLFNMDMMRQVLVPYLSSSEAPVYQAVDTLRRELITKIRSFQVHIAYNYTNLNNPDIIALAYNKFINDMDTYITEAYNIQKGLNEIAKLPKVYLVSLLVDNINYMKRMVEFAKKTILSVQYEQRLDWAVKLDDQATSIQTLMATMSPIFDKFQEYGLDQLSSFKSHLPNVPINVRVLDVQDVIVQQNMLLDQLRRYLQNPDVTNTVLSDVLKSATDRCEVLQATLKQNHLMVLKALEETPSYQREAISAVYSQALNQQYMLYEDIRTAYTSNRDRLLEVVQHLDRITNLEADLSILVNEQDKTLSNLQLNDVAEKEMKDNYYDGASPRSEDSYVTETVSETVPKPIDSNVGLFYGAQAYLNITWGERDLFDKKMSFEFVASRTVEQMLFIYRQMSAILMTPEMTYAINNQLSGETWKNWPALETLNSYNHLHLKAFYDKATLPEWLLKYASYFNDYLKVKYWNEYSQEKPVTFVPEGMFHTMVDISDFNKQWDLYLLTHNKFEKFLGLPKRRTFSTSPLVRPIKLIQDKIYGERCFVNKHKLLTLDKVAYELPNHLDTCRTVLAMDCSKEKAFAVTMIHSNSTYGSHIVQILAEDKEIEIVPGYLDIQVRVDGEILLLEDNVQVVYSKQVHYQQQTPVLKIIRRGLRVEVELPLTGIEIVMEGSHIALQVSRLYQKRVCGLCSNYDSQMSWEFEGPSQQIFTAAKPFASTYVLREGHCLRKDHVDIKHEMDSVPRPGHSYGDRYLDIRRPFRPKGSSGHVDMDERIERPKTEDICRPVPERTIRPRHKGTQECIPKKPVQKCPMDCPNPVETKTEKISYVCLDRNDKQVEEIRRAPSNRPIDLSKLTNVRGSSKKTVTHEVRCQLDEESS